MKSSIAYSTLLRRLRERYGPGEHSSLHWSTLRARRQKERERPRELRQAIRTLARRASHGMTAIKLEFLAKDHCVDTHADEEIIHYVTLSRTKTLDEAIELALEYEAMTKV